MCARLELLWQLAAELALAAMEEWTGKVRALLKLKAALGPARFDERRLRLLDALIASPEPVEDRAEALASAEDLGFFASAQELEEWTDRLLEASEPAAPDEAMPAKLDLDRLASEQSLVSQDPYETADDDTAFTDLLPVLPKLLRPEVPPPPTLVWLRCFIDPRGARNAR